MHRRRDLPVRLLARRLHGTCGCGRAGYGGIPSDISDDGGALEPLPGRWPSCKSKRDRIAELQEVIKLQEQIDEIKRAKDRPTNYEPRDPSPASACWIRWARTACRRALPTASSASLHLLDARLPHPHSARRWNWVCTPLPSTRCASRSCRRSGRASPTANSTKAQVVEQIWFPGVHSNVGGGYDNSGLSDVALAWMISRVETFTGLRFRGRRDPEDGLAVHGGDALPLEQGRRVRGRATFCRR